MDGAHPKRKKDKYNPYTLVEEKGYYFIRFKDSSGTPQNVPLTPDLYELFNSFELADISHMNLVTRHFEQSDLTEEAVSARSFLIPLTVEETAFLSCEKEVLHRAMDQLSESQQRRLRLYYWDGLTYEQIANLEGCSHPAIIKSINGAIKKLKKIFSQQGYNLTDN